MTDVSQKMNCVTPDSCILVINLLRKILGAFSFRRLFLWYFHVLLVGDKGVSWPISKTDDELVIPVVLAREAVLPYPKSKAYRSSQELEAALFTLIKALVTAEKYPEPLISTVMDHKRQNKSELTKHHIRH